jgi:hypothetical protein
MTRMSSGRGAFLAACLMAAPTTARAVDPPTMYDRKAEVTVTGVVIEVDSEAAAEGVVGVHLLVKTERAVLIVHVAPALFIGENNFWFQTDDRIEITGARVFHAGHPALWARTIVKDGKALRLRDEDGGPLWKTVAGEDADGCGVRHGPIR